MCELQTFWETPEKNQSSENLQMDGMGGGGGKGYFYKSSNCILNLAVEWFGDLSKFIVQVDIREPLFKPGMKYARKWEDITVSGVQMKWVKLFYLPRDDLRLRKDMPTIKIISFLDLEWERGRKKENSACKMQKSSLILQLWYILHCTH